MRCIGVGVALLLLMAAVAQAVCVTGTWDGVKPNGGINVTVTYPLYDLKTGQYTGQASEGTVAGIYTFKSATWYDGARLDEAGNATGQKITDPSYPTYMYAFCIDLRQNIAPPNVNSWYLAPDIHAPVPGPYGNPMTVAQATLLEELFGNYYQGAFDGKGFWPGNPNKNPVIEAAAFQVAVWETVWEQAGNPLEVNALMRASRGKLYVNCGWPAADRADYMLNHLDPTKHLALAALVDPKHQDQIILLPGGSFQHVPEPLTMAGLFLGLAGVAGYIRKRRMA